MRLRPALALVVAVLAAPSAAAAQSRNPVADADALFREAKRLISEERYEEACPKLEESQRLDPAGGTALTLALCHQAAGRLAAAYREFEAALAFAERDARGDRARVARDAIARLGPLLSRVVVHVDERNLALAGLEVKIDGKAVEPSESRFSVSVDGGAHTFRATAPGHTPFEARVEVAGKEDRRTLEIPRLEPLAAEQASAAPQRPPVASRAAKRPEERRDGSSGLWLGVTWASFGVALAGTATSTYFGLRARSRHESALDRCPASPCSDASGVELNDDARRDAWISTGAAGVAVAGAALGIVLLMTRKPAPARTSAGWSLHGSGLGIALARSL